MFFNLKTCSFMQFAQKIKKKTVKFLTCYLEFYLEIPLPEHFFLKKRVSIALKQISTSS